MVTLGTPDPGIDDAGQSILTGVAINAARVNTLSWPGRAVVCLMG
jgi:hypothetical protein